MVNIEWVIGNTYNPEDIASQFTMAKLKPIARDGVKHIYQAYDGTNLSNGRLFMSYNNQPEIRKYIEYNQGNIFFIREFKAYSDLRHYPATVKNKKLWVPSIAAIYAAFPGKGLKTNSCGTVTIY
ncbi:hypothetical protein D1872_50920 [compost metagenome]